MIDKEEKLLDTEQVLEKVGYGKTWLDERVAEGTFPAPKHKWRRNKWRVAVVDDWIRKEFGDDPVNQPMPAEAHAAH